MVKIPGLVLLVLGVVLLVYGFQARDSLASEVKEAIDGTPTDEAMRYLIGGAVAAVLGAGLLIVGKKK